MNLINSIMNKKYDVVALGELLIDFTENGISEQGNPVLEANPGGAPCNVLAMLNKLGKKSAFIGKVGHDMFGNQLKRAIEEVGIDSKGLIMDNDVHTTLAFVHTMEDGDRDFSFYRKLGADMMLSKADVDFEIINDSKIFHFGSLSMTDSVCREATMAALATAKEAGAFITFDPNLREPLWDSLDLAKEQIAYGMDKCDMLKISDNEIRWFTGIQDYDEAIDYLKEKYPNIKLILLSLGKDGSRAYTKSQTATANAFVRSDTVETTGAGDTFCACVINFVVECLDKGIQIDSLEEKDLYEMLRFANAAASLITTKKGALRVMPTRTEVEAVYTTV